MTDRAPFEEGEPFAYVRDEDAQAAPAAVEEDGCLYQMDGSGQWWCYSHHSAFGPFDTLDDARRRMAERA